MLGAIVESVAWSAVACLVWLATLSSVTLPELCFAIGAGLVSGVLGTAGRRSLGGAWRFRARWLLWPGPVAATLVAEFLALGRVVWSPREGRLEAIELPHEEVELNNGREASATLALCSTPGSIVADNDPDDHRLTVHVLVSAGPDLAKVVGR